MPKRNNKRKRFYGIILERSLRGLDKSLDRRLMKGDMQNQLSFHNQIFSNQKLGRL
jgi:hypothetical protein